MNTELPARVRVPEDILWQQVQERVVLLDLRSNEYHSLNESGSRMWMVLVDAGDACAALERLCGMYDAQRAVLARDLREFIEQLTESGLLKAESR